MSARRKSMKRARRAIACGAVLLAVGLAPGVRGQDTVSLCAEVKLEIRQELATERQAFDARMRISNGLPSLALEDLAITLWFRDLDGVPVSYTSNPNDPNALFYVTTDSLDGVGDVSGSGRVEPSSDAEIHWLIIPAPGAAGDFPTGMDYEIGATAVYTLGGEDEQVDVVPDTIHVNPMPRLYLDYFLPESVYADDAFTPAIEPPVPFSLGVRVRNSGHGTAYKLKIDSGQPQIVENELGLLISFLITGSEVNGVLAPESLLVDFGDLKGHSAGVARWIMETSLSGEFTEFTAEFSHADELGGELTSLMEGTAAHLMIGDVLVDAPARDGVRDFLARDGSVLTVYESDNLDTPVTDRSAVSTLVLAEENGTEQTYILTVPQTAGALYVSKPVVAGELRELVSVIRSDGKNLHPANTWFSKTRETGTDPWEYSLNLFDVNGGGVYTVTVDAPSVYPMPPVLQPIGDRSVLIGDPLGLGFLVEASDPNGTLPALTSTVLPPGASFTITTNDLLVRGTFLWLPGTEQGGIYPVEFTASDDTAQDSELVKLYVGQPGEPLDEDGIPLSLSGRSVVITNILASTTGQNARVQWVATPGFSYDVFASGGPMDDAVSWTLTRSNYTASAEGETFVDSAFTSDVNQRFYQVVLEGESPFSNGVWGVVRGDIEGAAHTFAAPPFRGDRSLDGSYGQGLAAALAGHDGGPGDELGDEIYFLRDDGRWRLVYLDAGGVWREEDGSPSTAALAEGQGMIVRRSVSEDVRMTLVGEVGNDGTRQVSVGEGWNLLALSEGRSIDLAAAFAITHPGGPIGAALEEDADQVILWDEAGQGYWLMYSLGGAWVDTATLQPVVLTLRPGQVIYYYRQPGYGTMKVTF